tara:strand:- start:27 stop:170 length:144 start_codon:yes stop_codon:yes gene_type:complete
MAERVKLIMPNGKDEIEVWDSDVEYFETLGYTANAEKPKKSKKGGDK